MPTELCPVHGLRFDPALSTGCSRCHQEREATSGSVPRRRLLAGGAAALATLGAAAAVYKYRSRFGSSLGGRALEVTEVSWQGQTGAVFEPATVPLTTPAPLILLLNPSGNARGIAERYAPAAQKLGWIAASCFQVADGTPDEADKDALLGLLAVVQARRAVDSARVFAGGFSGGACGAYRLAIIESGTVSGAIVECGHMGPWREVGERATPGLRFYLFTRQDDMNRPATRTLKSAMEGKGCRVMEVEKEGGHAPMTPAELEDALAWISA